MRGSGESQGKFTTLGIKESNDIYYILKELQKTFKTRSVLLYGRSMGAASLMKFVVERKKGIVNKIKPFQRLKESFSIHLITPSKDFFLILFTASKSRNN
jgi:predicted alpha/beta-fold hydrolase